MAITKLGKKLGRLGGGLCLGDLKGVGDQAVMGTKFYKGETYLVIEAYRLTRYNGASRKATNRIAIKMSDLIKLAKRSR